MSLNLTRKQRHNLLVALNEYFENEGFDTISRLPRNGIIGLAYTTYELTENENSDAHDIEVKFNLNTLNWENYIDFELVLEQHRYTVEDFIDEISGIEFEDVIRDCVDKGWELVESGKIKEVITDD